MSPVTRFILALHCHQPVGNFPWVFEEAYQAAYLPFVEMLKQHSKITAVLHYSGALLDWFREHHPEFLKALKTLVARGQVEMLGGGFYEPILTMIPRRDALGQLEKMRATLHRLGLVQADGPAGMWLAERVWEPQLPSLLAQAGIWYTIVDDHHLELARVPEEERFGFHLTEDQGKEIALFPSLKLLRYQVPFKPVAEVMEALRGFRSERPRAVVLADDGEKFGFWPGTARWVYQEGWLESFFTELERHSDWLIPMTLRQFLGEFPPLGKVTLPCASYPEMEEWSAGNFRNFLVKYPEAQTMHQKMLWISARLEAAESKVKPVSDTNLKEAREHLYRAQSNDAYWHGVFGGLYLRHLRRSVYAELLQAERLLDALERHGKKSWVEGQVTAQDFGRAGETTLRSPSVSLLLQPRQGGQLLEWSDKELCLNLLDTLTRRPEPYHKKAQVAHEASAGAAAGPETIHERHDTALRLVEPLVYDRTRRAGLIDHALLPDSKVQDFALGTFKELGDFVSEPYEGRLVRSGNRVSALLTRQGRVRLEEVDYPLLLKKTVTLPARGKRVTITYQLVNRSNRMLAFLFGSELNLNLKDAHVNRVGEVEGVKRFCVTDPAFRLRVSWSFSHPARLWYFPLETLSDSERGLERTYQGVNMTCLWRLALSPGKRWQVSETLTLETPHAAA